MIKEVCLFFALTYRAGTGVTENRIIHKTRDATDDTTDAAICCPDKVWTSRRGGSVCAGGARAPWLVPLVTGRTFTASPHSQPRAFSESRAHARLPHRRLTRPSG
ncbi:hypothetical protein AAFF_G00274200 [Aldrovandia affinis]|uniref:Uncharacterized protein n=1 Tax=Aldrovandia affinis TaxID=143900 RepID=A0AAD7WSN6_9TELE|nr:hypothetical protein AAFF_G00274200 [Aldrovandia affinis]